jgi:hypothetical protein
MKRRALLLLNNNKFGSNFVQDALPIELLGLVPKKIAHSPLVFGLFLVFHLLFVGV